MKVAAAISGGVDSIRAALLLREEGHEVFGLHMRTLPSPGDRGEMAETVFRREELLRRLAAKCELPLEIVDLREQFDSVVVRPFMEAYRKGLTPNPCIRCNPRIKFGLLMAEAGRLGAERLATGHYARVVAPGSYGSGRYELRRGTDPARDQSYFLMGLSQEQLSRVLFPLGGHTKRETAAWAEKHGISGLTAEDSQEICFISSGSYTDFISARVGDAPQGGPVTDLGGTILGRHTGIHRYTIGQRRGLGIPSTEPWYVVRIEPESNTVVVGRAKDLFRDSFLALSVNWVSMERPDGPLECRVRIRNLHNPAPAEVTPLDTNSAIVRFFEPQRAVTPGQAAVFYSGDVLLGGGIITPRP